MKGGSTRPCQSLTQSGRRASEKCTHVVKQRRRRHVDGVIVHTSRDALAIATMNDAMPLRYGISQFAVVISQLTSQAFASVENCLLLDRFIRLILWTLIIYAHPRPGSPNRSSANPPKLYLPKAPYIVENGG